MCPPKPSKVANIVPVKNEAPAKAPEPLEIDTGPDAKRRGRSSLRIDLAAPSSRGSGVNV